MQFEMKKIAKLDVLKPLSKVLPSPLQPRISRKNSPQTRKRPRTRYKKKIGRLRGTVVEIGNAQEHTALRGYDRIQSRWENYECKVSCAIQ